MQLKNESKSSFIDPNTGQLIEYVESKTYRVQITPDMFFMTFIQAVDFEFKLTRTELLLLSRMNHLSEMNTNKVFLVKERRDAIASEIGVGYQAISNAVRTLLSKDILIKESNNTFRINPHYYWKGALKERKNAINKLNIEFEITRDDE